MSLNTLLGLHGVSECEFYTRLGDAMKNNQEYLEIMDDEGNIARIHIPSLSFDPQLMNTMDGW